MKKTCLHVNMQPHSKREATLRCTCVVLGLVVFLFDSVDGQACLCRHQRRGNRLNLPKRLWKTNQAEESP